MVRPYVSMIVAALVGFTVVIVNSLSVPINHDEYQYLAAAALQRTHAMYGDYLYSQPPYFPVVLAAWTDLLSPTGIGFFVSARLFTALESCAVLVAFSLLMLRMSGRALVAAALTIALLYCSYMAMPLRFVRNDSLPLLAFILALLAIHAAVRKPPERAMWLYGVAGLLLSIATCTKHSYAFPALGLFVFACLASGPDWRTRLTGAAAPVAAGGVIGMLPALPFILPHLDTFLFANLEFHRTAHLYWIIGDTDWPLRWQLGWIARQLPDRPTLVLFVTLCIILALGWRQWRGLLMHDSPDRRMLALIVILTPCLVVGLFMARPMHPMYAAPLFPLAAGVVAMASRVAFPPGTEAPGWRTQWVAGVAIVAAGLLLHVVPVPPKPLGHFILRVAAPTPSPEDGSIQPAITGADL